MSKATIQMCMSTTGFGPQALRGLPQSKQPSQSPSSAYPTSSDADATYQPTGYFPQTRRPVPRFDMDLKDLFSDDETDKRSFSRISNQVGSMRPPPPPQQLVKQEQPQQQMQNFTGDLKISPQMRSHHVQQPQQSYPFSNLNSPQQQATYPATSNAPSLSPRIAQSPNHAQSPYQISNQLPYNAFAQNINNTYPDVGFSDLDFLDSFPVQGANSATDVADAAGGLQDLGFGMGFGDGTHDWSDGTGLDLFDGFFFGGSGGGTL